MAWLALKKLQSESIDDILTLSEKFLLLHVVNITCGVKHFTVLVMAESNRTYFLFEWHRLVAVGQLRCTGIISGTIIY